MESTRTFDDDFLTILSSSATAGSSSSQSIGSSLSPAKFKPGNHCKISYIMRDASLKSSRNFSIHTSKLHNIILGLNKLYHIYQTIHENVTFFT